MIKFLEKYKRILAVISLFLALSALIGIGIFGIGKPGKPQGDFIHYYSAGLTWASGDHMWDYKSFNKYYLEISGYLRGYDVGLAYPPNFSLISRFYSLFDFETAKLWNLGFLIASLLAMIFFIIKMVDQQAPQSIESKCFFSFFDYWKSFYPYAISFGASIFNCCCCGNCFLVFCLLCKV